MYEMGVGEPNRFFLSEQTSGLILPIKLSINFLNVKQHYFLIVIFISFLYALERDHTHRVSWTNKINNSVFDDTYVNIRFLIKGLISFPYQKTYQKNVSEALIRGPIKKPIKERTNLGSRYDPSPHPPRKTISFFVIFVYIFFYIV
jgi:hypothetical protein